MTKQKKVLTKINHESGDVEKLKAAQKAKFDEFYTPLDVVQAELSHYGELLKGKRIICPCDWDIFPEQNVFAMTIEFSETSEPCVWTKTWTINKVERIRYTLWDEPMEEVVVDGKEASNLLSSRVTCNFLRALKGIGETYGIKSVTASGYDPETGRGTPFQSIDYSQYDVCITNPPFSIYSEFMSKMIENSESRKNTDKPFDFIVMAPMLNRVTPNVGLPLMLRQCYLGFSRGIAVNFTNPDAKSDYKCKSVCVDWVTTFDIAQKEVNETRMHTGVDWDMYKDEFKEMPLITMKDGTHPIEIKSIGAYPDNYYGWAKVSCQALGRLSYDEFDWYLTSAKKYFNTSHPEKNPCTHKMSNEMVSPGFHGLLIKRKVSLQNQ